jgi:hypothetical protein
MLVILCVLLVIGIILQVLILKRVAVLQKPLIVYPDRQTTASENNLPVKNSNDIEIEEYMLENGISKDMYELSIYSATNSYNKLLKG